MVPQIWLWSRLFGAAQTYKPGTCTWYDKPVANLPVPFKPGTVHHILTLTHTKKKQLLNTTAWTALQRNSTNTIGSILGY